MSLNYSPGAFAQSIRMRRQKIGGERTLLIVEGSTDKSAMSAVLHDDVYLVPGRGKDLLLRAHQQLMNEPLENCLFLIDCDGESNSAALGAEDIIISEYRDVEADLVCRLRAFQKVAINLFSENEDSVADIRAKSQTIEDYGLGLTGCFGIVLDAGRGKGVRLRLQDPTTNQKRRIELRDLPAFAAWIEAHEIPTFHDMALAIGSKLLWSDADCRTIAEVSEAGGMKECRQHGKSSCGRCIPRNFSNGHSLVDVFAHLLSHHTSQTIEAREVARSLRSGADLRVVSEWSTAKRMHKWQSEHGVNLLATDIVI